MLAPYGLAAAEAYHVENIMVASLVAGLNLGAGLGWLWLLGPAGPPADR